MRYLLALVLGIFLTATVTPAYAQQCAAGAYPQADMAGIYVSPESRMRVEIYPCGGTYVQWENAYGTHKAAYYSTNPITGGGVAASGMSPDAISGTYLDGSDRIGFKPGSPGYIEVVTLGVYDATYRMYLLRKIA